MARKWNPKLEPEEKKYLECVVINNVDKVIRKEEQKKFIGELNNMLFSTWTPGKLKVCLAAVRKELGVKGKRGGTFGPRKQKVHLTPNDLSIGEEIDNILSAARCKILKIVKKRIQEPADELKRVKEELRDKTDRLKALTKIRQAVEDYKG